MTKLPLSLGAFALVLAAAAPAVAADTMSKAQMASLAKCKAAPKKSAKCVAMMKAHPDSAMKAEGSMMAPEGGMMSSEKPKS